MNSVTAVGGMVLQVFVNQMGTAYVAAYAACMKVCGLFEQPGITLGLALLTFTGQNYGAGKYDRIKQGVRAGVVLSVLVNLPFAALEIFCPKFLASLMLNDATVISYTCIFLPVTGVALFALAGCLSSETPAREWEKQFCRWCPGLWRLPCASWLCCF